MLPGRRLIFKALGIIRNSLGEVAAESSSGQVNLRNRVQFYCSRFSNAYHSKRSVCDIVEDCVPSSHMVYQWLNILTCT